MNAINKCFPKARIITTLAFLVTALAITTHPNKAYAVDEICGDGIDNNADGKTDCEDTACSSTTACPSCRSMVFSNADNPEYGCLVAAALDLSMPGETGKVKTMVETWSQKRLEAYNKRLERLTRTYFYQAFDYAYSYEQVFGNKTASPVVEPMTTDAIGEGLRGSATLLDVLAIGRGGLPHGYKKASTATCCASCAQPCVAPVPAPTAP